MTRLLAVLSLLVASALGISGGNSPQMFDALGGDPDVSGAKIADADKATASDVARSRASLLALKMGAGYRPTSVTTYYRLTVSGPEQFGRGDLSVDPWAIACAGSSSPTCLRSRYLPATEEVCSAYRRAFGVPTCGVPAGGWSRGPSSERWGAAKLALETLCSKRSPWVDGAGHDCIPLSIEIARLGAFGGEALVTEAARLEALDQGAVCGDGIPDPGETCRTCPADMGPCEPPPVNPPAPTARRCTSWPSGSPVEFRPGLSSTGRTEVRLIGPGSMDDCQ